MTAAKKTEDDNLDIPDFLRVANRKKTKYEARDQVTFDAPPEPWEVALASVQPPEFREYLVERMRKGQFMQRWLVVDEKRGHYQANVDEALASWRAKFEERAAKAEQQRAAARERLAAIPRKPSATKGLVPLRQILRDMGDAAPSRRTAVMAVEAAKLIHVKYHWPNSPVTLAHVRQAIESFQPPPKTSKVVFAREDVIRWQGPNPKKVGSAAHARWEFLEKHHGKTVGAYEDADGNLTTLKNAIALGRANLEKGKIDDSVGGKPAEKVQPEKRERVRRKAKEAKKVARGKRPRQKDGRAGKRKSHK